MRGRLTQVCKILRQAAGKRMHFDRLKRREFITLLVGATAWPVATPAQIPTPVIGFLSARSPEESAHLVDAYRRALKEGGFIEARTSQLSFAGRTATTAACPPWRPIS